MIILLIKAFIVPCIALALSLLRSKVIPFSSTFIVISFNINGVYYFDQYKQDSYDNEKISLYDCLEKFREEEILTNDNKISGDDIAIKDMQKQEKNPVLDNYVGQYENNSKKSNSKA